MDFEANKKPTEITREVRLEVLTLETFILALMDSGTKSRGKKLIS